MMIDVGLVLARLLHYSATTTLAGVSFFPLYAYSGSEPESLKRWRRRLLLRTAAAALLGGLLWFVFAVANMSGSLADLADPATIWSVVGETGFGTVWAIRMALAVIIVGVAAMRPFSTTTIHHDLITPLLAAILLGSLAGTGHSQVEDGWEGLVHVGADAAHLLAAGAWLGGLIPLGFILVGSATASRDAGPIDIDGILMRFSGMGYVAVAMLVGSGFVNCWFLVGSPSNLLSSLYGRILLLKLVFFVVMLALAVANRFWLVPSMSEIPTDASGASVWTSRLRNHVLGEQFLGLMVLLAVSALGTVRPAAG